MKSSRITRSGTPDYLRCILNTYKKAAYGLNKFDIAKKIEEVSDRIIDAEEVKNYLVINRVEDDELITKIEHKSYGEKPIKDKITHMYNNLKMTAEQVSYALDISLKSVYESTTARAIVRKKTKKMDAKTFNDMEIMLRNGETQKNVAIELEISVSNVSRWHKAFLKYNNVGTLDEIENIFKAIREFLIAIEDKEIKKELFDKPTKGDGNHKHPDRKLVSNSKDEINFITQKTNKINLITLDLPADIFDAVNDITMTA